MSSTAEISYNLYRRFPISVRRIAANMRGCYLRAWRYGPESERLIAEALEREAWPAETWKTWQENKLGMILSHAATKVPFYRSQWAERRRRGDRRSIEYLENWPILKKTQLKDNPMAFLADGCDTRTMYEEQTSGTSGTPLKLWWSKKTVRQMYALFEARAKRWHGVSRHENWCTLGGQPIISENATSPPFWIWNAPLNQLYMSANHLNGKHASSFGLALQRYRISHMTAYSSAASFLGQELSRCPEYFERIDLVTTNGEPLTEWQREIIIRGLAKNVRETYGMAEIVTSASECQNGSLHIWPELGHIEILDDYEEFRVKAGMTGRFVCTGLLNMDMPLIRYEVGDRGRIQPEGEPCACGRSLPVISSIEGRSDDVLLAPDGKRIYWINPVFYGLPLYEAQVVQKELGSVQVNFVPAPGFTSGHGQDIVERIKARMGNIRVELKQVDAIPRERNGKFKAVCCRL